MGSHGTSSYYIKCSPHLQLGGLLCSPGCFLPSPSGPLSFAEQPCQAGLWRSPQLVSDKLDLSKLQSTLSGNSGEQPEGSQLVLKTSQETSWITLFSYFQNNPETVTGLCWVSPMHNSNQSQSSPLGHCSLNATSQQSLWHINGSEGGV